MTSVAKRLKNITASPITKTRQEAFSDTLIESDAPAHTENSQTSTEISAQQEQQGTLPPPSSPNTWRKWLLALKQIWPLYLAVHITFLIVTYLANLFSLGNFSQNAFSLRTFLDAWNRWDTGHFTSIALHGYDTTWRAAFFPLYSLLERALMVTGLDPFITGLIISNLAMLLLCAVLYRLVEEDFSTELAARTVRYLILFPTAFFLVAAYNESIFLCFALLSFYHIRHGSWWWAGLFGLLAALTRSAGLFLLVPFCYEYARQHRFQLKMLRFDVLAGLLIPIGLGLFAIYCYLHYHDWLAFSHAQSTWDRALDFPWKGLTHSLAIIAKRRVLTFDSIHNVIDLSAELLMLVLTLLSFVGPWRFGRELRVYALYGTTFYLFLILFPASGGFPLQSLSRQVLEVFPAFIVLATIGKRARFNLYYMMISEAVLCFMLLQFLTGRWIV